MPDWEVYERLVARMVADQLDTSFSVTPNAFVVGKITGARRQVDVLIDARHDTDNSRRIIIDAKKKSRKIDVKDVESFAGFMQDVGATHGYLVSPAGCTKAAQRRAQESITIRILPLDRLENFDPSTWPSCQRDGCDRGRVFWNGYPELTMALTAIDSSVCTTASYVHYVGKCDRCGRFHVRCLTCQDMLSPPEDDDEDVGHHCSCKPPWFWLASIESDEQGHRSAELHACLANGQVLTVDRRSL